MKLLGVGLQLMKARCGAGNGRPSYSCCPEMQDTIPYCPKKPFWNFKRTLYFSLLTFGAGIYTGIYISQNYEVPRVDDPQKLVQRMNEKIRELIDDNKKKSAAEQIVHDIKKEAKKILDD
ncbi:uncharacterized protein LOC108153010 isoform X1 [Drosophila miranda]|uniref:Uncharacterized protein isoform X1 n=3 Tax=pseudoobscura subgroup TaxID=32358 RepID=Q2M0P3_DROPS|nr:uncharacterized protein LOC4813491 isoform X1 [Drosophila pseudoobscura]XP_017138245.1 uncharacterized protein LOC108153010 isoform X1 [Drosophila miranda]